MMKFRCRFCQEVLFCLTSGVVLAGDVVLLDEEVLFLTRCRFAGVVLLEVLFCCGRLRIEVKQTKLLSLPTVKTRFAGSKLGDER